MALYVPGSVQVMVVEVSLILVTTGGSGTSGVSTEGVVPLAVTAVLTLTRLPALGDPFSA